MSSLTIICAYFIDLANYSASPWPGYTIASLSTFFSNALIEATNSFELPPGKSVLPTPYPNKVSPDINILAYLL